MKHTLIIILLFIIQTTIKAQFSKSFEDITEYELSNKLWSEFEQLNYKNGVLLIDSILQITDSPDRFVLTMGLTSGLNTDNKDLVKRTIQLAASNNYQLSYYRNKIAEIYPELVKSNQGVFIKTESEVENFDLAQKLAQMFVNDQVCFSSYFDHIVKRSKQLGYNVQVNQNNNCDELFLNQATTLQSLLRQYPEISENLVGKFGMTAIFTIIQHSPETELPKFKSNMANWYEKGDIKPRNYALYLDRYSLNKNIPQLYGSQLSRATDTLTFHPIEDIDNINNRRMKMGLESIERYAAYFKIKWNDEYVEKLKTDYNHR